MTYGNDGDVSSAAAETTAGTEEILDFSSNVNCVPLPESVREAIEGSLGSLRRYPDAAVWELRARAAERFGVAVEGLLAGSGATEFIYAIPRRLGPRRVVIVAPCYHDYWRATDHAGAEAEGVLAAESGEFMPDMAQVEAYLSGTDMAFLGNPNNPTGVALSADVIRTLAGKFPETILVVDESYVEFVPPSAGASVLGGPLPENVIVLRSLSCFYGLPGLRLGFMIGSEEICAQVGRAREPWTVSVPAMAAGVAILSEAVDMAAMREAVIGERERVREVLSRMAGLRVFRSQANFLLVKITRPGLTSARLCERMLRQKLLIRNASGFRGLDSKFVRISIRGAGDNDRLLAGLTAAFDEGQWK